MSHRSILGLPPHPYVVPLLERLSTVGLFDCRVDAGARNALQLRERHLHAALLTPVEYGRDSSDYVVLPGAAIAARDPSGPVSLVVRRGARTIATLAADPACAGEIVLARILLAEEFNAFPSIVPASGTLSGMLDRADAALVVGQPEHLPRGVTALDLVEDWFELTDLPYCYGMWCMREGVLSRVAADTIAETHRSVDAQPAAGDVGGSAFSYLLTTEVQESIREMLHYAFYHGMLPDVPDLRFASWEDDDASGDDLMAG